MPLSEIVSTPTVDPVVLERAFAFGNMLKKTCIVVQNAPGFAINRIFMPYAQIVAFLSKSHILSLLNDLILLL
jgi:3-hydroxyacyl-CoA dehydrogenase